MGSNPVMMRDMRIVTSEYQLTDYEAREEAAERQAVLSGQSSRAGQQGRSWRAWFVWILFIVLAASVYLLMRLSKPAPSPTATQAAETTATHSKLLANVWGLLSCSSTIPVFLLVVILAIQPVRARATMPFERPVQRDRRMRRLMTVAMLLAPALGLTAEILLSGPANQTVDLRLFSLVQIGPWAIVLVVFYLRVRWISRKAQTSLGDADSPSRLTYRCAFSDGGVELACAQYTTLYRWSHFVSYLETPRLLVL